MFIVSPLRADILSNVFNENDAISHLILKDKSFLLKDSLNFKTSFNFKDKPSGDFRLSDISGLTVNDLKNITVTFYAYLFEKNKETLAPKAVDRIGIYVKISFVF
jgi:hypothetical protein